MLNHTVQRRFGRFLFRRLIDIRVRIIQTPDERRIIETAFVDVARMAIV